MDAGITRGKNTWMSASKIMQKTTDTGIVAFNISHALLQHNYYELEDVNILLTTN